MSIRACGNGPTPFLAASSIQPAKTQAGCFICQRKPAKTRQREARSFDGALLDWRKIELDQLPIEPTKAKAKEPPADDRTPEGERELDKWMNRLLKASKGSRNDTLNRAAYWLGHSVGRKELREDAVIEALQRTARAIGLEEREIAAMIKSGLYDGIAHAIAEEQAASGSAETTTQSNGDKTTAAKGSDARKKNRRFVSGRTLFTVDEKGVWAANAETQIRMKICSPLYIEADTRNARGEGWGRLLLFQDREGREKSWVMPRAWLAGDRSRYREKLLDMGLAISPEPEAPALLHARV